MPLNLHPTGQKVAFGKSSGVSCVEQANLEKNKPPNTHPTGFASRHSARQRVMYQPIEQQKEKMAIARKFGDKVYIWNVPDLLARATDLPVCETSVDRFNLDVDAWFGEAGKPTIKHVLHHMRVIQNADLSDPILLSAEGHVFDGLHRIAKCVIDGVATINYRQFEVNPEPFEIVDFEEFNRQKPLIAESLVWMERNLL